MINNHFSYSPINAAKEAAQVMAIINITPDSFFSGSRTTTKEQITQRVTEVIKQGATILDLGGYSTRPGADEVSPEEEFSRLDLTFEVIRGISADITLSVDTFRADVVEKLYEKWGSFIVNDISAGRLDSNMIRLVGRIGLPYIAMHSRGTPNTMQSMTNYSDFNGEMLEFFKEKISECHNAGIKELILDPGFGFAKTTEQNYQLLNHMEEIVKLGYPVLAGLSRKTMIWKTLNTTPEKALNGTTMLNWEALRQGATILRVHDVAEAVEVTKIFHIFEMSNFASKTA